MFAGSLAKQQNEVLYGGEKNPIVTLTNEIRYNILNKGLLTGKLSYINNKFVGNSNSTIGYEMLAGLQTGNNFTWSLGLQRNIGSGIQLNLNYEGRRSIQVTQYTRAICRLEPIFNYFKVISDFPITNPSA